MLIQHADEVKQIYADLLICNYAIEPTEFWLYGYSDGKRYKFISFGDCQIFSDLYMQYAERLCHPVLGTIRLFVCNYRLRYSADQI